MVCCIDSVITTGNCVVSVTRAEIIANFSKSRRAIVVTVNSPRRVRRDRVLPDVAGCVVKLNTVATVRGNGVMKNIWTSGVIKGQAAGSIVYVIGDRAVADSYRGSARHSYGRATVRLDLFHGTIL